MTTVTSKSSASASQSSVEELRGRLDAGPVVLVEDEEARPPRLSVRSLHATRRLTSSRDGRRRLRILFAHPAYWPATAFGGPIWVEARAARAPRRSAGMQRRRRRRRASSISTIPATRITRSSRVDGAASTTSRPPSATAGWGSRRRCRSRSPAATARRRARLRLPGRRHAPATATWAASRRIPYVLEPLGMFRPQLRKVRSSGRSTRRSAAASRRAPPRSSSSSQLERGGRRRLRESRPSGWSSAETGFRRRSRASHAGAPRDSGIPAGGTARPLRRPDRRRKGHRAPARGVAELPDAHLVLVGPDDGHGTSRSSGAAQAAIRRHCPRVHLLHRTSSSKLCRRRARASPRPARASAWSPPRPPRRHARRR